MKTLIRLVTFVGLPIGIMKVATMNFAFANGIVVGLTIAFALAYFASYIFND